MRVSHVHSADFDDPNLVSIAGLGPLLGLARRAGLHDLIEAHVQVSAVGGANPVAKVASLVAGMAAGADSIDDMDLLGFGRWDVSEAGDRYQLRASRVGWQAGGR